MPTYDDQVSNPDLDELEKMYSAPASAESGSSKLATQGQRGARYGNNGPGGTNTHAARYNNGSSGKTNTRNDRHGNNGSGFKTPTSPANARELKNNEEAASSHHDGTTEGSPNQVGKGFTGSGKSAENTKAHGFLAKLKNSSKFKQRLLIGGALAGGSTIGAVLLFLAMLPLKIEHIVTNLEEHFSVAATNAVENEVEEDFNGYVKNSVLASMNRGTCKSTIDPSCVVTPSGTGYFGRLYAGWSDGRMMNKLANLPNGDSIIISKKRNTFYMTLNGQDFDLTKVMQGKQSIFDVAGTKKTSRSEIRATIRNALKDGTLWDKTYKRFLIGKYLEARFGIKRCVAFCDVRDKFADTVENKKLAGKLWLIQKVQGPYAQSYGLLIQCILAPDQCDTKLKVSSDGRETSDLNSKLEEQLAEYIAENGVSKLADLAQKAGDINKLGLSGYMTKLLAEQLAEKLDGDGAKVATGEALDKAVPIAGQIDLAVQIIKEEKAVPEITKDLAYESRAVAAVQEAEMFESIVSEMHAGHMDVTEFGSVNDLLSSSIKDVNGLSSDATSTPLYSQIMGSPALVNASIFGDIFGGNASADSVTSSSTYPCNDGKPVPNGDRTCPEENFADPGVYVKALSFFLDNAEAASAFGFHLPSYIPGAAEYNSAVAPALGAVFKLDEWFGDLAGLVSDAAVKTCTLTPPCSVALNGFTSQFSQLAGWALQQIMPNPLGSITGGRNFDMIAAGEDVQSNSYCQEELGCRKATDGEVAALQNQQIAEQKQEFESQSMFARMFNTSSSYSLISRLAMTMPTNMLSATNSSLASVLTNPLGRLGGMFGSIFSTNHAFAATDVRSDPFGITQYVPDMSGVGDREAYWNQNCVNGPMATFDDTTNIVTPTPQWLEAHTTQDPNMQAVTTASNPCQTIGAGIKAAGAMFATGVLSSDELNNDAAGTPSTSSGTIPTGTAQDLAKQLDASPNISFQTPADESYFKEIENTGRQTQCGGVDISPKLLGVLLALSQNYKIVIGVFADGNCSGNHAKGLAVDLNGINPLSGSGGTGNHITWASSEQPIIKQFYGDAANILSANGGGSLGQTECFSGVAHPTPVANVDYFPDLCNHLHVSVGRHGN